MSKFELKRFETKKIIINYDSDFLVSKRALNDLSFLNE